VWLLSYAEFEEIGNYLKYSELDSYYKHNFDSDKGMPLKRP